MAITTLDGLLTAQRQKITYTKQGSRTTLAGCWFSLFDLAGIPAPGSLTAGNTANGIVPDSTQAGYPPLSAFGSGANGYLNNIDFSNIVSGRIAIFDRVFVAGTFSVAVLGLGVASTLSSQPSFAARLPQTDYNATQIWVEQVTAPSGNLAIAASYTNQSGVTGKSTGATGVGAPQTVGRCFQLPFAVGDSGVQKIESVTGTVTASGTFNIMVLRPLWQGRVQIPYANDIHEFLHVGLPQIYASSALYVMICPDSVLSGTPDMNFVIGNG